MTDRERILTHIIQALAIHSEDFKKTYYANTSFKPHNWVISRFVHYDTERKCYVVRDLVTGKLCDYWNESFSIINKKMVK